MTDPPGHQHHQIDYLEFGVTDMARAQRFYAEVRPGGPLVILYSEALDDTPGRVQAAGGVVTVEPFDFPGGRRFHFRDPSGNELAVWSER